MTRTSVPGEQACWPTVVATHPVIAALFDTTMNTFSRLPAVRADDGLFAYAWVLLLYVLLCIT